MGKGFGAGGDGVAGEDGEGLGGGEPVGIDAEFDGEGGVGGDELGGGNGGGFLFGVEFFRELGVGVLERDGVG